MTLVTKRGGPIKVGTTTVTEVMLSNVWTELECRLQYRRATNCARIVIY